MNWNKRPYTIYLIRNLANGMAYVGCTFHSVRDRFIHHASGETYRRPLTQAIKEYGRSAFEIELLGSTTGCKEAQLLEAAAIRAWETLAPAGYNQNAVLGDERFEREFGRWIGKTA